MSNAPHLKVNSGHAHHLLGIPSRNPPDAIVWRSVSRGQPESFFNLDLPIKYAPFPKLHGLRWRHKLPTNHAGAKTSRGRRSTAWNTDTTGSAQAKHASPPLRFLLYLNPNGTHTLSPQCWCCREPTILAQIKSTVSLFCMNSFR